MPDSHRVVVYAIYRIVIIRLEILDIQALIPFSRVWNLIQRPESGIKRPFNGAIDRPIRSIEALPIYLNQKKRARRWIKPDHRKVMRDG